MENLTVAIIVRKFPNIVQTYILNQIVALKELATNTIIIAGKRGEYEKLPQAINNYSLLDNTIYIETRFRAILRAILSLTFFNKNYRTAVKRILVSNIWKDYGIRYYLKVLIRARALSLGPVHIIHSHSFFTSFDYLFLRHVFSIPLITTYHGRLPPDVPIIDKNKLQIVLNMGDLFLANTCCARDELIDLGCLPEKIRIIPQGINIADFPYVPRSINPMNKIILLSVGRLSAEKGHRIAVKALSELNGEFPTMEYHLVGEGTEKEALLKLAREHGLGNKLVIHGFKTGDELHSFYERAHIFVLPSLAETQGLVLQEAQASGLPVIGSAVGGIPEVIIDNVTGLLFRNNDYHNLAVMIRRLILDQAIYNKLAISGRNDVMKRFDSSNLGQKLSSVYNEILARK